MGLDKSGLAEKYKEYVLENDAPPASVYRFAHYAEIEEDDFYELFPSVGAVKALVFAALFQEVLDSLEADDTYAAYSSREKMLALYYTLFERFKRERSYLKLSLKPSTVFYPGDEGLESAQKIFENHWSGLFGQGKETGEISERKYVDMIYAPLLWRHFVFLLNYWLEDTSADFSKTDAAIEKSVNMAMDVIGRNLIDSVWDFGFHLLKEKFGKMMG